MNFEFRNYNVRLTFNPADITIRMEHRENRRLYESTFMTEDFECLSAIGGLSTFENILKTAFGSDDSAKITIVEEKIDTLTLKVEVSGLISKCWTLGLAARRRESGDTAVEVEELREQIKYLQNKISSYLTTLHILESKISDYILIPGCPVISCTLDKINFVESMIPNNFPITCTVHNCLHKVIGVEKLSTYNFGHQYINCTAGHNIHWSLKEYFKFVNPPSYDLETNTYTVKDPEDIACAYDVYHIETIEHLEELSITHTKPFTLGFISEYKLKKLTLHCPNLENDIIDDIGNCKTLEEIDLEGCIKITNVNGLAELPALTKLNIKGTAVKNTAALTNSRLMIEK